MIVALTTIVVFSSCSSSDDDGGGFSGSFAVSPKNLTFTNNGGTTSLSVRSEAQPTVTSDASWLNASFNKKGALAYLFNITTDSIAADSVNMTGYDDRTGTLTITQGSNTASITVTQTAKYGLFVTSSKTVDVDANGGSYDITLKSNADFEISTDANWIILPSETKASLTDYTRTVTISPNFTTEARTGRVSFTQNGITESVTFNQETGGAMTHTAMELAKQMYPGWNLGNTLEGGSSSNNDTNNGGLGAETSWQSTKTTQAIIDYVAAQGFKAVRIPCSWVCGHISDTSNNTIDADWMKRVQEVVDYCINDGLYVIINDHYDGGWLEQSFSDVSDATVTAKSAKLNALWTQIATHFKNYDEHLIFAGLNEPGMNEISTFDASTTSALIKYEQTFIDAVRATGGNNARRTIIVQGPLTNIDQTNNLWDVTKLTDTATDRLMVEVHFYEPWQFCGLDADANWGKIYYYWGTGNEGTSERTTPTAYAETYVNAQFAKMKAKYADKGYPVIIGEYGANYRFSDDAKHNASIEAFYKAVNQYAINNGCVPFAWDTNYLGYPNMTIINRSQTTVNNTYMLNGIIEGVKAGSWPY